MGIYQRKLGAVVKNRLEGQIDSAAQAGVEMIELLWNQLDAYSTTVVGVQELKVEHVAQGIGRNTLQLRKTWIEDGELVFWPEMGSPVIENKCRCYGYLADTKKNRLVLADMIRFNKFTIIDEKIRKEIFDLAKSEGIDTIIVRDTTMDKYLSRKDPKQGKILDLQAEKEELERKLKLYEDEAAKPPLKGVTIDKSKLGVKTAINTNVVKGL